jgi:hypothetical protein
MKPVYIQMVCWIEALEGNDFADILSLFKQKGCPQAFAFFATSILEGTYGKP